MTETDGGLQFTWDWEREKFQKSARAEGTYLLRAHWTERDPAALGQVAERAAQVEVCVALGMLEALTDAEARALLRAVLGALRTGAVLYTENFVPTHPTRLIMEWFQGFHVCYRSVEELRVLALTAAADPGRLELKLDSSGSLALCKALKERQRPTLGRVSASGHLRRHQQRRHGLFRQVFLLAGRVP